MTTRTAATPSRSGHADDASVIFNPIRFRNLEVKNRIFRDRMEGVGVVSAADAIADGWAGPCLRSTGVDYDVRKDQPYLVYDRFEFDVPVGTRGDNYDRYLVRIYELRQSIRILEQALDQIPPGPILLCDYKVVLPAKGEVYNTIEGMIAHFKLIMDGIRVPAGDQTGKPWYAFGRFWFRLAPQESVAFCFIQNQV